ncbi:MAG: hypothetical protein ACR2J3_10540 [Aridibacter sp.]
MSDLLSTDLDSPSSTPYFLWDEPMTVGEDFLREFFKRENQFYLLFQIY